jgi:phosphocarrier protein FPr
MVTLGRENVRLGVAAANKAEAIRQVGNLLVESGFIQPTYIDSMLSREEAANTFLGNGIAIPHGLPNDRDLILNTGIAVVQLPDGVEWNPDEIVHLVVGIAAKSDEHLQILTNLTHVLDDAKAVEQLAQTSDVQLIIERLTRSPKPASDEPDLDLPDAQAVDVIIRGKAGLHARPATAFVDLAKSFESEIRVRYGHQIANGKRLMSLLKLGVEQGAVIRLMAQGTDEADALQTLQAAIERGLEDEEEADVSTHDDMPPLNLDAEAIAGIAASPGIAIARLHRFQRQQLVFAETTDNPIADAERLHQAVATAKAELTELYQTVKQQSGASKAAIFQAHREFLDDPEMVADAINRMEGDRSAAWAWQQTVDDRANALAALSDPILSGRAADVRDVGRRVLKQLVGDTDDAVSLPDEPVILLADDLAPSDTVSFDPERIQGFCTAVGGATSHTAIIARSLNIPAVVGAGETILSLDAVPAVLDGNHGQLYINPSDADLEKARQAQANQQTQRDRAFQARYQPAMTPDGHRVEVVANIGSAEEAAQAIEAGAEGVGLLRTEFLFLGRSQPPSEDEQFAVLQQMTQALGKLPLIVRTLDIGGDKEIPYLHLPKEENPFLGVRGIRLCFQETALFETQLRAIFRASDSGYLRLMFPMIATLEDLRSAKAMVESVRSTLDSRPIEIGMMVEVPSAVMMATEFAAEIDFFSIGTNDLTQYLLAMDRGHPTLAKQADGLHPSVLRAVDQTVKAAKAAGKWVGVCGGIAGDPHGAAILAGLGVAELSVSIPSIPVIKAKLRGLSMQQMQQLGRRALQCRTAEEVRNL